jgi:hypothetical protein
MSRAIFENVCMVCWRGYYITLYYCMDFNYDIVWCVPFNLNCYFVTFLTIFLQHNNFVNQYGSILCPM